MLGTGLIATGVLALVGPFMDWAERDQIGMRPAATGVMLAGVIFVAWGAHRRHIARQELRRAESEQRRGRHGSRRRATRDSSVRDAPPASQPFDR